MCLYLDLQLVCFLFIAVFAWIYARSDTLCSFELEDVHLNPDGKVFTFFFPGTYAYFPGKYAHMFSSKCTKCKVPKWCNYALLEKNHSKNRNLSNEHLFVFLRGCRYIWMNWNDLTVTSAWWLDRESSPITIFRFVNYYNSARPLYTYIYIYVYLCPIIMIVTIMVFPICLTISPYRSHLLHTIIYIYISIDIYIYRYVYIYI